MTGGFYPVDGGAGAANPFRRCPPRGAADESRAAGRDQAPFVVEDIDYHDPAPGRVLVRTGASPFCSTDCVNWRGELGKIPPTILGHASMGEVLEVGAGVDAHEAPATA